MMSRSPIREVIKNELFSESPAHLTESINIPKFQIGINIIKPDMQPFFKCVFILNFRYDMEWDVKSKYNFHVQSATEIIEDKKDIPLWALESTGNKELIHFEKMLDENLQKKGFIMKSELMKDVNIEAFNESIKKELNRFLTEDLLKKL